MRAILSPRAIAVCLGVFLVSAAVVARVRATHTGETLEMGQGNSVETGTAGTFVVKRFAAGTVTITAKDSDATAALALEAGGAAAMTYGTASTTAHTFSSDSTGNGEFVVPAESVGAGEILNTTRNVSLATSAFYDCTGSEILGWTSGADAKPNFALVNSAGPVIAYDATAGSVDTNEACSTFYVPADYASAGSFKVRVTQGAATATNQESVTCRVSIDGAVLGTASAANLTNQTAVQTATSTPAGTYAAGASVSVLCKQGNASADDTVNILAIAYEYQGVQ